ncbi:MAG: aldo/keto reductase [Candidatus Omnitrophota bacterium]|nr:aldo/keto reductase [Candidatus Omnitrophota bacterium]MBU1894798.1 aldo/keto reductase [Candidatus Omnitrophota bacterium]
MEYRKIGNSDMEVSSISLGSWVFGGDVWGKVDDNVSLRVIEEAIARGVNMIDTAPIYGYGRAEEVIARALQKKAKRVMIATKCGLEGKGAAVRPNLSAKFIRQEIENSLRRLNVETIDLYQCHWPDPNTSLSETFGELKKLADEGKIKFIGVCNFSKNLLEEAVSIAPIISNQVQYSLLDREIEKDLVSYCAENKISILSYGSLGGGILTGKYKAPPSYSKGDVKSFFYRYYKEPFWSKAQELVRILENVAETHKVSVSQTAINWVLSRNIVASCLVGCRTPEQLEQNINAVNWKLNEEELARIEAVEL